MRYFLSRHIPQFKRVLLVESGSRTLLEPLIPGLYQTGGAGTRVDLVTCFSGAPSALNPDNSVVFRVGDYGGGAGRDKLLRELVGRGYDIMGIICSAEPVMTKWKWWLAAKIPAKVFILNENGDYFWLDWSQWRIIIHFVLFRAGLTGPGAVPALMRLLVFPFTLAYLLGFAAWAHLKRAVRLAAAR
ncbi:MAG TPA: hypothetical protein VFA28_19525 [Bryobacteraceae bacterium]|nr:hypothetical protein [Bryobacteraceae bacterium]